MSVPRKDPSISSPVSQLSSRKELSTQSSDPLTTSTGFRRPTYSAFPPFYSLQPNLSTRARQLELWTQLVLGYCKFHRIFMLSISSLPPDLFSNSKLGRDLKPSSIRTVLDHISTPAGGSRIEWVTQTVQGEPSSSCYVWWRTAAEWAQLLLSWVEETGQKGSVLTMYELREGDTTEKCEWKGMDEPMLRKVISSLGKTGKAQIFAGHGGSGDGEGVKFF